MRRTAGTARNSQAQLGGCLDHVEWDDIRDSDSNAARFARGEIDDCLSDAGPFCEQYLVNGAEALNNAPL